MTAGARVNPLVARAYFLRGLVIWVGVRAIASAVMLLGGADPLHVPASVHLTLAAVAVLASSAQTVRHRERMLLANLGVSAIEVVAWFAAAAMAGEIGLAFIGGLAT